MKLSLPWSNSDRSVSQIVAGLSDMVSELEQKSVSCDSRINGCEASKAAEDESHDARIKAETERHEDAVLRLKATHSNLVNEKKSAETIATNLKGILGL